MKVLFYSIHHTCIPVFGVEMDTMADYIEKGDDVYVLRCHGELEYCDLNPFHNEDVCKECNRSFYKNIKYLQLPKENILQIPKLKVSYDSLPAEFNNVKELMEYKYDNIKLGLSTASTIISELKEHQFSTIEYKDKVGKVLRTAFFTYSFMQEVFKELNPDLFCFSGGRTANIYSAYKLALKLEIDTCSFVGAGRMGLHHRLYNHLCFEFDKYTANMEELWANGPVDKMEIGAQWFIDKRNGCDVEWASHTKNQTRGLLPEELQSGKRKNIALFNSSIYEYVAVEGLHNRIYKDETDGIRNILEAFKDNDDYFFFLRVHPNLKGNENSQIRELKEIHSKGYINLRIIWPDEVVDTYSLMDACDKTLVFSSTIGVEACYWEKPIILVGRKTTYDNLDCCYKPQTHEEVVELIKSDLVPKDKVEAVKYGFWMSTYGYNYKRYKPLNYGIGTFAGKSMVVKSIIFERAFNKFLKLLKQQVVKVMFFLTPRFFKNMVYRKIEEELNAKRGDVVYSYASGGEDLILDNLLFGKDNGLFVEVAPGTPIVKSNSYLFYLKGWKVINLVVDKKIINDYKKLRPNDDTIEIPSLEVNNNARSWKAVAESIKDRTKGNKIDSLSIGTDFLELEFLNNLDWKSNKASTILVRAQSIQEPFINDKVYSFFTDKGYSIVAKTVDFVFFKDCGSN